MIKSFLFLISISSIIFGQFSNRYTDSSFIFEQVLTDEIYATAPELNIPYSVESLTHLEDLKFHLFAPEGDTLTKRPMLITIHGGAFITGEKEHDDMLEFCKIFANRGYVTATIQYRIGMNILDNNSAERAVYRGLQDGRAAIRYFRENAEILGIDTNNIYILGSSAGAFVGLHNLYMNEESERPASTFNSPDLGGYDAISPEINHNSHPNGLIALWGALKDTTLIKREDSDVPLYLVHGTNDNTVGYDVSPPFGLSFLPSTFGSKPIEEQLKRLGHSPKTYFVDGEGHEFYGVSNGSWDPSPNIYWDTVVTGVSDFLHEIHKPTANFSYEFLSDNVHFKDLSEDVIGWHWNFGDGETSTQQNPEHRYSEIGNYKVTLTIQNDIASWDTVSSMVAFGITNLEDNQVTNRFHLKQNYPNPFNPTTIISYSIASSGNVSLKVYDILGNKVSTLIDENKSAGNHKIEFDATELSSGIYYYTLNANNFVQSKKMILLK